MPDNIKFGLTIPQGWRRGDPPSDQENNPVSQYEFSKRYSSWYMWIQYVTLPMPMLGIISDEWF